ncbi:MAG: VOC family protein [Acetobacteraceae bacterium]
MAVSPIPAGYHALTPYIVVDNADRALTWYADVLGAREVMRLPIPGGKIGHAEIEIGDSRLMLADEAPEHQALSPATIGGSPVKLHLYVTDVDTVFARAVAAGATASMAPADQFYGDRSATIVDPFGHSWHIATHIEDVSDEEVRRRLAALYSGS